jgi:hypothetical protein
LYKLYLTLRYLFRRRVAIVPILAVTLCVMMDLIVASVMGGFLDEIRKAARGLFGDVIVTEESLAGFGYYDTWLDAEGNAHPGLLQALGELDEVAAATPIIETYGLARLSRKEQKGWTKGVNILGINGPVTTGADEILHKMGVMVVPDVVANSGGVIVCHFERTQGLSDQYWDIETVYTKLEERITKAYRQSAKTAKDAGGCSLRHGAWIFSLRKVEGAMKLRGWI